MASAVEALGMSLPYSSSTPAVDPAKATECLSAGAAIRNLLEMDLKPRDIMTRPAFENALVLLMALGGSTNAVLHLIAMARAVDVPLTIDDFQKVSNRVPFLADLLRNTLLKVFGQSGAGLFAVPSAIDAEVRRQYGVRLVGRVDVVERFYAITVERKLKHPAVVAIAETARREIFV